jgi:outer membrane protein TolC
VTRRREEASGSSRTGGRGRPGAAGHRRTETAGIVLAAVLAILPAEPAHAQEWTIQAAADSALSSHPAIRLAEANVREANAGEAVARSQMLPALAGTATITRFEEPMIVAPFHSLDLSSPPDFELALVQSQLGIDYTLFDGGARAARIRGAMATTDAMTARREDTSMALLNEVVAAYTGVLLARHVREAATRQTAALQAEMERAEQRFDEGTVPRVEVMRAQAALMDARAEEVTATSAVGVAERRLARATGVAPAAISNVPLRDLATRSDRAQGALGEAAESPLVEAAASAAAGARARVAEERAGRLPTLEAQAGLRTYGSTSGDFVAEWQTGLLLSWPLLTGGARGGRIARAEAELDAAEARRQEVELQVATSLDTADAAASEAAARVEAFQASVERWTEVARIEELALDEGTGVQQDYLTAEAALYQARAGQVRSRYDEILALAARAQALGELDRAWLDRALEDAP